MSASSAFCWCATAIALAGTVLNVRKSRLCFHLWTATNLMWLAVDLRCGLYSRAILDAVQLSLAVWGIFAWRSDGGEGRGDGV